MKTLEVYERVLEPATQMELDTQEGLFTKPWVDWLPELNVIEEEARSWEQKGWVPQLPEDREQVVPPNGTIMKSIRFARDVARSGLTDEQIEALFADIGKPPMLDPDTAVYSFSKGWVQPKPGNYLEDIQDEEFASELFNNLEEESLWKLHEVIEEALGIDSPSFTIRCR